MHPKFIEYDYERGIFRPLAKVDPKESKRVKVLPYDDQEEILDEYADIIKLGQMTHHGEIMDPGEDWPVAGAGLKPSADDHSDGWAPWHGLIPGTDAKGQ